MRTGEEAIARLCNPEAKVSAHYVVEEDGRIFALVPEQKRAWHAGISHWRGRDGLNDVSIGIEIVNPGHEFGYRPFPKAQMKALATLCREILSRHPIPARNVVGHSDIAPDRKEDPGELFDWLLLADKGVGIFSCGLSPKWQDDPLPELCAGQAGEAVASLQETLKEFGYGIDVTGVFDDRTCHVVRAFQRHFRPKLILEIWDSECAETLSRLLATIEAEKLIRRIHEAFGDTRPPAVLSPVYPGYEDAEQCMPQVYLGGKRWQDIDFDVMERYPLGDACLCFINEEGYRYVLPAFMVMALQRGAWSNAMLMYSARYSLRYKARLAGFDAAQLAVIREFIVFTFNHYFSGEEGEDEILALLDKAIQGG